MPRPASMQCVNRARGQPQLGVAQRLAHLAEHRIGLAVWVAELDPP